MILPFFHIYVHTFSWRAPGTPTWASDWEAAGSLGYQCCSCCAWDASQEGCPWGAPESLPGNSQAMLEQLAGRSASCMFGPSSTGGAVKEEPVEKKEGAKESAKKESAEDAKKKEGVKASAKKDSKDSKEKGSAQASAKKEPKGSKRGSAKEGAKGEPSKGSK